MGWNEREARKGVKSEGATKKNKMIEFFELNFFFLFHFNCLLILVYDTLTALHSILSRPVLFTSAKEFEIYSNLMTRGVSSFFLLSLSSLLLNLSRSTVVSEPLQAMAATRITEPKTEEYSDIISHSALKG